MVSTRSSVDPPEGPHDGRMRKQPRDDLQRARGGAAVGVDQRARRRAERGPAHGIARRARSAPPRARRRWPPARRRRSRGRGRRSRRSSTSTARRQSDARAPPARGCCARRSVPGFRQRTPPSRSGTASASSPIVSSTTTSARGSASTASSVRRAVAKPSPRAMCITSVNRSWWRGAMISSACGEACLIRRNARSTGSSSPRIVLPATTTMRSCGTRK